MDTVPLAELHKRWHGTLKSYLIGLSLSVILTLAAYFLVLEHLFSGWVLDASIIGLGIVQAAAQVLFFLHLGQETKPRWYLAVFLFMLTFLVIIVLGSLWIMFNLNERGMM